jgi:hypothetical protein
MILTDFVVCYERLWFDRYKSSTTRLRLKVDAVQHTMFTMIRVETMEI